MTVPQDTSTISIIDADEHAVVSVQEMLGGLEAGFSIYCDAESFLLSVHDGQPLPACLITELLLPGLSGLELFRLLKANEAHVPTVLVTAEASVPMAVQAIRAGVADYFLKPLNEPRLRHVVATILGRTAQQPVSDGGMRRG
ncbi:MAG: response regulator [Pseudomonadota bacterium]